MTDPMKFAMDSLMAGSNVDNAFRRILAGQTAPTEPDAIELLRAIVAAYDKSLTYENTTIPSILMATIEAARKVA